MTIRKLILVAGLSSILATAPLLAHHSVAAQYDRNKPANLTGSVSRIEWINPHARFIMDVKDASGKIAHWEIELSAPAILMRRGWTQKSLKIGDVVTVSGSSAKDGSTMAYATSVTLADGKRVFSGSANEQ